MSFEEFSQVLVLFLRDMGEFRNNYTFQWIKNARKEIRSIFDDFSNNKPSIPLEKVGDMFLYLIEKAKGKDFIRLQRKIDFSFDKILEKSLKDSILSFKGFMLFLKKNQKSVSFSDFMRIGTVIRVLNFPVGRELPLKETPKKLEYIEILKDVTSQNYEFILGKYSEMAGGQREKLELAKIPGFLRVIFIDFLRIVDDGVNLLRGDEEERVNIYMRVYLYDYLRLDQDFHKARRQYKNYLDFSQIFDFLKFIVLSLDSIVV